MDYLLKDNKMTLLFNGEINSINAMDIENDVTETLEDKEFNSLYLDFANLTYASSAGLRIILKLKQKYKDVYVINCNDEVYSILEMTGFTNIMSVRRTLIEVSVEGCPVIGSGYFSTVYRLDKEMIIKVFNRVSDENQIERELKMAKQAFILGIPTAISYDVVKVGDKLGVRFEMLDCMSLRDAFLKYPESYDKYLHKYYELIKTINTTHCDNPEVPDKKEFFLNELKDLREHFEPAIYDKLYNMVNNIENANTFVHGDSHFKNVMVLNDELTLIDMDTLSRGHFIFELASLRCPYVAFDEDDPGNCERFFGMKHEFAEKLYYDLLDLYFGGATLEQKEKIALLSYAHMMWWNQTNEPDSLQHFKGCKERLLKLLEKYDNLEV